METMVLYNPVTHPGTDRISHVDCGLCSERILTFDDRLTSGKYDALIASHFRSRHLAHMKNLAKTVALPREWIE